MLTWKPTLLFILRDFSRGRTIFFLIASSLAIASVSVLSTSAILSGFREMLVSGARGWLGDLVVVPPDTESNVRQAADIVSSVEALPGTNQASIRSAGSGVLKYQEKTAYPFGVVGVNPSTESHVSRLSTNLIEGEFLEEYRDSDEVVLGQDLADSLVGSMYDGERIAVGSMVDFSGSAGTTARFRVKGIIDAKTFLPNQAVFMHKDDLDRLNEGVRNSSVVIALDPRLDPEIVRGFLQGKYPDMVVKTWSEESGYVNDILQTVQYVTFLVISLVIFSVFVVVSIVIFINVSQKKRQIGIMKSMGMTESRIVSLFALEAVIYFILAYLAGIALFFLVHSYSLTHPKPLLIGEFHTVVEWQNIVLYFVILFVASLLGGVLPAVHIARKNVIEMLRQT